jgi:hypothetical protein
MASSEYGYLDVPLLYFSKLSVEADDEAEVRAEEACENEELSRAR